MYIILIKGQPIHNNHSKYLYLFQKINHEKSKQIAFTFILSSRVILFEAHLVRRLIISNIIYYT